MIADNSKAAWKNRAALMKKTLKGGKPKMDCEKIICGRLKDAQNALKNGYNEQAEYDAALLTVVLDLCEKYEHPPSLATPEKSTAIAHGVPYADYVMDELNDADKYWQNYQQTKKDVFKHLARQEMSHAAALLEEVADKNVAAELKSRMMQMERVIR